MFFVFLSSVFKLLNSLPLQFPCFFDPRWSKRSARSLFPGVFREKRKKKKNLEASPYHHRAFSFSRVNKSSDSPRLGNHGVRFCTPRLHNRAAWFTHTRRDSNFRGAKRKARRITFRGLEGAHSGPSPRHLSSPSSAVYTSCIRFCSNPHVRFKPRTLSFDRPRSNYFHARCFHQNCTIFFPPKTQTLITHRIHVSMSHSRR